jgi:TPR repeat protein/rRNA maturation protein Nop10
MAQKLVRCIEGHVYDSLANEKCPVCGSGQAHSEPEPKKPEKKQSKKSQDAASTGEGGRQPAIGRPIYIAGGVGVLLLLVVGVWALGPFGPSDPGTPNGPPLQKKSETSDTSNTNNSSKSSASVETTSDKPEPTKDGDNGDKPKATPDTGDKPKTADKPKPADKPKTTQNTGGPLNDCDRYAMSPVDPDHLAGVSGPMTVGEIDAAAAVPACERATRDFPDERRYWTDLGRAYRAANNGVGAAMAYQKALDKGSAFAAFATGLMMRNGTAMERNPTRARSLILKGAEAGIAPAMVAYGNMLAAGVGGPEDVKEAARWYQKAADAGSAAALNLLGNLYLKGKLGTADPAKARELFERSANMKDPEGIAWLGYLSEKGLGVKQDLAAARAKYTEAAEAGSTWSMRHIASLVSAGKLKAREPDEALHWLTMAAKRGDSAAMTDLGNAYRDRKFSSVPDYAAARQWFEKAAARGNSNAMNALGLAYHMAQGVPRDYAIARSWYEKAAQRGNVAAIANLGVFYEFGSGVPQNYSKAWQLFEEAANKGNAFAMHHLGQMTEYGKGMQADFARAVKWYVKAGDSGHADGYWRAAYLFDHYSKKKDLAFITKLALAAAKQGSQDALQVLFRDPGRISREVRAAIETELANKGFYQGSVRGRFDRKAREALEAYLRGGQ